MTKASRKGGGLELLLLGPPRVRFGGRPLMGADGRELPYKSIVLLCYLAVAARPVARKELSRAFWPDGDDANLRVALARLRACEGAESWLDTGANVSVRARTDLESFEKAADRDDHETAWRLWGSRVDPRHHVLRGAEARRLPADLIEFWLEPLREAAYQRYLGLLFRAAVDHEQNGRHESAIEFALDLLELDPLEESALQRVMRLHLNRGDPQSALVQFERTRRRLEEERLPPASTETVKLASEARAALDAVMASDGANATARGAKLPQAPTAFIGRERELDELADLLLASDGRLLTLVGPGGAGKSRLALMLAQRVATSFPDGVAFAALDAVPGPGDLPAALALALGSRANAGADGIGSLLERVRGKRHLLLLDNFEHLTDAAGLVNQLAAATSGGVIVTSRVPLNLQREQIYAVEGLVWPETEHDAAFEQRSAVQLFLKSARRSAPGFSLPLQERPALIQLCHFVGGLPLYLEHLANWVRILAPSEMVEELASGLELFESPHKDLPERHRRLDLVMQQGWDRLPEAVKKTLTELSHFRGGFTAAAAREVTGARLGELRVALEASFVTQQDGRFRIHEAVRAFSARQRRQGSGVERRHADYYLERARAMAADVSQGRAQIWRDDYLLERGNYQQAVAWSLRAGDATLSAAFGAALGSAWFSYGDFLEGRAHLERITRLAEDGPERRRALVHYGGILWTVGEFAAGEEVLRRSLNESQSAADETNQLLALGGLGAIAIRQVRDVDATAHYEEALALAERLGNERLRATILNNLAIIANKRGETAAAEKLYLRALSINRQLGDTAGIAIATGNVGIIQHQLGKLDAAARSYEESARLKRELGMRDGLGITLGNLGILYRDRGDLAKATTCLEEALRSAREVGNRPRIADSLRLLATLLGYQGNRVEAWRMHQESMAISEEVADPGAISAGLNDMALFAPDVTTKRELLERSLRVGRGTGRPENLRSTLANLAPLAADDQEFEQARALLAEALGTSESGAAGARYEPWANHVLLEAAYVAQAAGAPESALMLAAFVGERTKESGIVLSSLLRSKTDAVVERARSELSAAGAATAEARGREMSYADAVAVAVWAEPVRRGREAEEVG